MSSRPRVNRASILLFALLATLLLAGSAFGQNNASNNFVKLECPLNAPINPGDSIEIKVYIANSVPLGGLSWGFKYNTDFFELTSAKAGPALTIPGGFGSFLVQAKPADNQLLIGWLNFMPLAPLPVNAPGNPGHLASLYLRRLPGATDGCINIDSSFVPPAGFNLFTPQSSGDIIESVGWVDCGTEDVIVGAGCAVTNNPPNAICQPRVVNAGANCTAAADVNNGSNDPDGDPITVVQEPAGPYGLGVTNVKLIVTDDKGLADTCETTVTVQDNTAPVIACPENVSVNTSPGLCSGIANFAAPTATDNCDGSVSISVDAVSGASFPKGVTVVTAIAMDDAGNADTCQFTITVTDNEAPVAICPADINAETAPGEPDVIVNFNIDFTDNCPGGNVAANPPSGSAFPVGNNVVTVTATDAAGNQNQCTFNVNVTAGNQPPVVSDIPNQTILVGQSFNAIALDDFVTDPDHADDQLTWTATMMKSKGTISVNIDPLTRVATIDITPDFVGSAVFTFRATDPEGAFDEDQATFTVNTVPNDPPVVSDIPDQTVTAPALFATIDLNEYVTDPDNADNEISWSFSGNTQLGVVIDGGNVATISYPGGFTGSETITFTATDPGTLFDSDAATFTVNPELNPDFTFDATPEEVVVDINTQTEFQYTIDVGVIDNFVGSINLDVFGLPTGVSGVFTINPINAPGSSFFNGTVSAEAVAGTYPVVFQGTVVARGLVSSLKVDTVSLVLTGCSAAPAVVVTPEIVNVTAEEGSSPADESVVIINGAVCGTLFWTAESDQPWVTVEPASGDVDAGGPGDLVTLMFNTASLEPGDYTAHVSVLPVTLKTPRANEGAMVTINLTIEPKPVSADTVYVGDVMGYPGGDVAVPVSFRNFEELAGMSAGLTWDDAVATLDSVSYSGSRVEYISTKISTINNVNRTVALGVLRIPPEALIATGSGLWANLWFSIDNNAPAGVVHIDTTFIAPGVELLFNDEMANSIYPQFVKGSITIENIPENCISGFVIDENGDPISGATVQLWLNGVVTDVTTSGTDGSFEFCLMAPPNDAYVVRAFKAGFYPDLKGVDLPSSGTELVLGGDAGEITPTYEWVDLYCDGAAIANGMPIPDGSVVEAFDPDGVLCGRWFVSEPGSFGFMPVYVDDPYSPGVDEGCVIGDVITIKYNGQPVSLLGDPDPIFWTGNGDRYSACFEYPAKPDQVTKCLHLQQGWNLVSFNVTLPTSDLESLLADVLDNTDVILSFESEGLTYDPDLPEFSTLSTIDNLHGYWFRMDAADSICVTGKLVNSATPINLESNWNLVSYLPDSPKPVAEALGSIHSSIIVVLGYDGGGLSYDPANPGLSTLEELAPCFGYWIKTNAPGVLVYEGEGGGVMARASGNVSPVQVSNTWISLFGRNATLNGAAIPAGTVIEAYNASGLLVGATTVTQDGKFGFMSVYGSENFSSNQDIAETGAISFKINGETADQSIDWTANGDRVEINAFTTAKGGVLPTSFSLGQNFPNPFNPETSIEYTLAAAGRVEVAIYNVLGAKIKTLVNDVQPAGTYTIRWLGNDESGQTVASGVYFYKLTAGDFTATRKMTLLK